MRLPSESYLEQRARWPQQGRHILACFDDERVVVYQAYRPAIGHHAATHGRFGGEFSFGRMSWIKPNFLWMMYRSGWGQKPGQEITLAISLAREGFDQILREAVHSSYVEAIYRDRERWQRRVSGSEVRLQWDPDHGPKGDKLERRAIQLGLRGETLRRYAETWALEIEDISAFVAEQRERLDEPAALQTPRERVYPVRDPAVAAKLGLD